MKRSSGVIDLGVKNAGIPPGELILAYRIRKRQESDGLGAGDVDCCVLEGLSSLKELGCFADRAISRTAAKLDGVAVGVALCSASGEASEDAALPGLVSVAEVDVELSHLPRG